ARIAQAFGAAYVPQHYFVDADYVFGSGEQHYLSFNASSAGRYRSTASSAQATRAGFPAFFPAVVGSMNTPVLSERTETSRPASMPISSASGFGITTPIEVPILMTFCLMFMGDILL